MLEPLTRSAPAADMASMTRQSVAALVLARDAERDLAACLDSLAWVDRVVVVVDAASVDGTLAVARKSADAVIVRPLEDFSAQRNAGLAEVDADWVLAVDADERVSPGLAAEVRAVINSPDGPDGYRIRRSTTILGRRFRASGMAGYRPLRLFRSRQGRWVGRVHEEVALSGKVGELAEPLDHETLENLGEFLRKLDRYTSMEAADRLATGRRPDPLDLAARPVWTFLKLYLARGGFRDGVEGFLYAALSGLSVLVRHGKHRELRRGA